MNTQEQQINFHRARDALLSVIALVVVGFFFVLAKPFLIPFSIACFIFFILRPIISVFSRWKMPQFFMTTIIVGAIFLVGCLIGFILFSSIRSFVRDLPKFIPALQDLILQFQQYLANFLGQDIEELLNYENIIVSVRDQLLAISGNFISFLRGFLVVLFILFFLLLESRYFTRKLRVAFPHEQARRANDVITRISEQIGKYLSTKFIISVMTALTVLIILLAFRVNYAIVWASLTFLFNFVPFVGSIIITAICIVFVTLQFFTTPILIVIIAFLLILVHTIFGNIIEPRYLGKNMGMSPLIVIISLLLWGWLWGIAGAFIAVPLTAMFKIIFENIPSLHFLAALMDSGNTKFYEKQKNINR